MEAHKNNTRSLDCLVCFSSYNTKDRRPRVLPCGHTFCSKCIFDYLCTNEVTCPSCRKLHQATSCTEFPVNFELERVLEEQTQISEIPSKPYDTSRCISKKLRCRRIEASNEAEDLVTKSREISSHLLQYKQKVKKSIDTHKALAEEHIASIDGFQMESIKIEEAIVEEGNQRKKIGSAKSSLLSASTAPEILLALENVDICCEDLDCINQRMIESFPNEDLITQSKELVELSKRALPSISVCGEEEMGEDELDNEKTSPSISQPLVNQAEGFVASMAKVDREIDRVSLDDFVSTSSSIQEKIDRAFQKLPSWKTHQAVQTEMSAILRVRDLVEMTPFARQLLESNRVFAVHKDHCVGTRLRYGRITLEDRGMVCLHVLGNSPPESFHEDSFLLQFDDIMDLVEGSSLLTFLELGVEDEAGGAGARTLGKILIRLTFDSKYSLNFTRLCTGEMGPSYANSSIVKVLDKGNNKERIKLGDYEGKDGEGGKAVVTGIDWDEEHKRNVHKRSSWVKGLVWGYRAEAVASLIAILTKDDPGGPVSGGIFGMVEDGMDILTKTVSEYRNVKEVKIIDCGIVLSL